MNRIFSLVAALFIGCASAAPPREACVPAVPSFSPPVVADPVWVQSSADHQPLWLCATPYESRWGTYLGEVDSHWHSPDGPAHIFLAVDANDGREARTGCLFKTGCEAAPDEDDGACVDFGQCCVLVDVGAVTQLK